MRIGIDARFYGPFGKGLGRYVQKLIEHLEQLDHPHQVTVFLRKENWEACQLYDSRFTKALADYPWYSISEQTGFPRLLRRGNFDLMHFPHYNVPLFYRRPFVVTIHDLIVSRYPTVRASTLNPLVYRLKHEAYQWVIRSAVNRARRILTVSQYSKQVLQSTFRIPGKKIVVTYEAAEPLSAGAATSGAKERLAPRAPYLLYVGNAYPHKNLEGLLSAFVLLKKTVHSPLKLVLVGKMDYFFRRIVQRAALLRLGDDVVFPGFVTDEELAALYAHAALYVFPSFEEGFGLPPLEAMSAGVPVASSNRSCLPEILGDAAAFFDPDQPRQMAEVLRRLLAHPDERSRLRKKGISRVARFRWDDLARTTLDVYTKAGASSHA